MKKFMAMCLITVVLLFAGCAEKSKEDPYTNKYFDAVNNVILECINETEQATLKIIYTYAPNELDLLEARTEMTFKNLTAEQMATYKNMFAGNLYKDIDGYTLEEKIEGNNYTTISRMDLEKIPSGHIEVEDDEVTIDVVSLTAARSKISNQTGYTCTIK